MAGKKTVILGATPNESRYAYLAAERLNTYGHEIVPVGIKKGIVFGKEILDLRKKPNLNQVDTITLYINPVHMMEWENYILSIRPKRIIFNPGTENHSFMERAREEGIEVLEACTLTMLSVGLY